MGDAFARLTSAVFVYSKQEKTRVRQTGDQTLTVATLHHLAGTGGTIISKCIAAMSGAYVLSEIHPYVAQSPLMRFDPLAAAAQFQRHYGALTPVEARHVLGLQLRVLAQRANADGKTLVIRDHSHSDFYVGKASFRPSLIMSVLEVGLRPLSVVTIRDPVESYISIVREQWHDSITFDHYCKRWLQFIRVYSRFPTFLYEDFCSNPAAAISKICAEFRIPFESDYAERLGNIRLTGNSGRSSDVIEPRPQRPIPIEMQSDVRTSKAYRTILEMYPKYQREIV